MKGRIDRWTAHEEKVLREMWERRSPLEHIEERLRRSRSSVKSKLQQMGLKRNGQQQIVDEICTHSDD